MLFRHRDKLFVVLVLPVRTLVNIWLSLRSKQQFGLQVVQLLRPISSVTYCNLIIRIIDWLINPHISTNRNSLNISHDNDRHNGWIHMLSSVFDFRKQILHKGRGIKIFPTTSKFFVVKNWTINLRYVTIISRNKFLINNKNTTGLKKVLIFYLQFLLQNIKILLPFSFVMCSWSLSISRLEDLHKKISLSIMGKNIAHNPFGTLPPIKSFNNKRPNSTIRLLWSRSNLR